MELPPLGPTPFNNPIIYVERRLPGAESTGCHPEDSLRGLRFEGEGREGNFGVFFWDPIIYTSGKWPPSQTKHTSSRDPIFHFHDYGRKSKY